MLAQTDWTLQEWVNSFSDDYANSLLVGMATRQVADRWRISCEKRSFSSIPQCSGGRASSISTWIAYEVGLANEISHRLGSGHDGYSIFLIMLPLRIYCAAILMLVSVSAPLSRYFGKTSPPDASAIPDSAVLWEREKLVN